MFFDLRSICLEIEGFFVVLREFEVCFVCLGADTVVSDIDGLRYTTLLYGTGPGHSEPRALPLNTTTSAANADAVHAAAVPRQWATHGAEDVPIYALGKL